MRGRPEILLVTTVLLVPFVYAVSYIPDVCAAPKEPEWGMGEGLCEFVDETQKRMVCCWSEPDKNNPGEFISWCQTCDSDGTNCGPVSLKESTGIPRSGVLEDPSTLPNLSQNVIPKGGGALEQPTEKITPDSNDNKSILSDLTPEQMADIVKRMQAAAEAKAR